MQVKKDEPVRIHPFQLRGYLCVDCSKSYLPKYLSKRPWNAFPCLASSLAIS